VTAHSLSDTAKRTYNTLIHGATKQVSDYEQRFSALTNLYDDLLANLIKQSFSFQETYRTAADFFGSATVNFAGVDGTLYSRPLFDMVLFFGGAYAATGTITFSENKGPTVHYDTKTMQQNMGLSSVVPIYINEIPEVDHTFSAQEQPDELNPSKTVTDEKIADNSMIANFIMTFSEYYLAYKIAASRGQTTQIILMDRSLSAERASLLYETRKTDFWTAKCNLLGYAIKGDNPIDKNDLALARQHVCSHSLSLPPPRGDYLRYAITCLAEHKQQITVEQILAEFEITDEKRSRRVKGALKNLVSKQILREVNQFYTLNPKYVSTWNRIKKVTVDVGERLFVSNNGETEKAGSMKILKNGEERWLTTLDISFLTLFAFQMLIEECWRKHILLIGVTKDTAARDFKRQLVPILQNKKLLKADTQGNSLQKLPNTDRMILQSASILNVEKVTPPWSLIEYDSAFRSMLPDKKRRPSYVSGAIKNKISLERTFVKTYVQLSQAKTAPMLRSNVLLVDRLTYLEFDLKPESIVRFMNELSDGTTEPVETILYTDKTVPNKLQNLVMNILKAMAPENIPEAFGYNKALFIADKIAKWNYNQFKCIVDTTATWILNNHKLRNFIFYMSTFRERRASIEQTRRENR
jgi:hypothetical protein